MDSIISGIREYLNGCDILSEFTVKNRHIDWTEDNENYGIMPDGEKLLRKFISGGGKMQYNFTLYVRRLSVTDAQRLQNAEMLERLQRWCTSNSLNGIFPALPDGCTPTKISAENAMLLEQGKPSTYQIQFTLIYMKRGN